MVDNPYAGAARFRRELRQFLRRSEDCARKHGITPRQHILLLQIAGAPDGKTTVSELVVSLALTQSAVTELVQRAEGAGLVKRSVSKDDGRVVDLTLTAAGAQKLAAVHDALGPERLQLRSAIDALGD